ncbi:MAG: redoxin domain-containing protein [Chloroflexi bacterium]|nr:redoxin domain-containing protein [Chloroflexota bacterium]
MPALSDLQRKVGADGVQVLGISCDTVYALKAWADELKGVEIPLCSDFWPHGALSRAYGVFNEGVGRPERAIFVIDRAGIVRYIDVHALREVPDMAEIEDELKKIP